jgi:hypothetical protein
MTLDELVSQLKKAYGDSLRAVVLYGSAAAGEHIPKRSDYNVLVIVDQLGMEQLRAAGAVAQAWGESDNPPPMTMTTAEWRSSADIFPMEYADILERHKVLYGTPAFDGIKVSKADLRLQVENQAMGKLLRMRQAIMAAGMDGKRQIELLEDSLSALMVLFRAVERLNGDVPPTDYLTLSQEVAERASFDASPFAKVVRHVRGEQKLSTAEAPGVLAGYLAGLEQVIRYLDRFSATH